MTKKFCVVCLFFFLLLFSGLTFALEVKANSGPTLKEFKAKLETDPVYVERLNRLREEVEAFALTFFMPGYQDI